MIKNQPRHQYVIGVIVTLVFVGMIIFANWLVTTQGMWPIGFGLEAVSGTMFVGFVIAARDIIQDTLGRTTILALIAVGTAISFTMSAPAIAFASAAAFGFGELMNFAVYTPIRTKSKLGDKRWATAVVSSNIVASLIDSIMFLAIAFGITSIGVEVLGQFVGKMYATIAYLIIGWVIGRIRAGSLQAFEQQGIVSR